MFLARIVPEKGLHYLIDAFMQTDTDKKLVIAGGVSHSGEYAKQIHDMAKDDRIIFTGFVEGTSFGSFIIIAECMYFRVTLRVCR